MHTASVSLRGFAGCGQKSRRSQESHFEKHCIADVLRSMLASAMPSYPLVSYLLDV
jgi:hypothetical protein